MHSFIDGLTNEQQFSTQIQTSLMPRLHLAKNSKLGLGTRLSTNLVSCRVGHKKTMPVTCKRNFFSSKLRGREHFG